ncbi:MAG: hypothetical protein M3O36_06990 [Myxococcota bacterium]|nr:hypothetical protein [Myxococcota bacterium]
MMRRIWEFPLSLASAAVFVATAASADPPKETKARCIDANTQSQSLRRSGNFSGARAELTVCVDARCPKMVRNDCIQRLDELERAQPTVVFDAKDPSGADLSAVKVTVDGHPFTEKLDGTALPMDPGEHSFTFEVPGQPPVSRRLVVEEGEKGRREHVVIGVPTPAVTPGTPRPLEPPAPEPASGGSNIGRPIGLIAGGLGIAGIAAGGIFGLMTNSAISQQKQECSPDGCTPAGHAQALSDHDLAVKYGLYSNVGFIAGGVLLAGGAALFFLSRPADAGSASPSAGLVVAPSLERSGGSLVVRGSF